MTEDLGMFGPSGASHWTPIPAPPKEDREAGEREIECQHCHGTRETYKAVNEEDVLPCRHCGDREAGKLTKAEWIEQYGGQAELDREGFEVVPCVDCDDSICHGWKVVPREAAQSTAAEVIAACEKALDLLAEDIEGSLSQESFDAREEALAIIARWKEANHAK